MDILDTNLSTADTESLLAVMVSRVEEVRLGMDVTLDMELLAQGHGRVPEGGGVGGQRFCSTA